MPQINTEKDWHCGINFCNKNKGKWKQKKSGDNQITILDLSP
jgi:hypothetical protein